MMLPSFSQKVLVLPLYSVIEQPAFASLEQWIWFGSKQLLSFFSNITLENPTHITDLRRFSMSPSHPELLKWAGQNGYHYIISGSVDVDVTPAGTMDCIRLQFKLLDINSLQTRFDVEYRYAQFEEKQATPQQFTLLWSGLKQLLAWLCGQMMGCIQPETWTSEYDNLNPTILGTDLAAFKTLYTTCEKTDDPHQQYALLKALLTENSEHLLAHWEMSVLKKRLKEYADCAQHLQQAYQVMAHCIPSKRALCATELGVCYALLKNTEKAVELWKTAIFEDPRLVHPYLNLALAYEEMGNMDKAEVYFMQATYRVPEDSRAYFNLARIYSKQEQWDKAIEQYERLILTEPENAWAYSNLANLLLQKGDLDLAKIYLQKTRELDRDGEAGRFAELVLSSLEAAEV